MLKLKTDCNVCLHRDVCRNKGNGEMAKRMLDNITYGNGPNTDYGWNSISDKMGINIEISCPDYVEENCMKGK